MSRAVGEAGAPLEKVFRPPKVRKPLRSKKPMRRSNPERRVEKYARNFNEHRDFIASLPCAVRGKRDCRWDRRVVAAHVVARGIGGVKGSWRDLIPLSADLHHEQHTMTMPAFEQRYGVPLRALRHVLVVADPGVTIEEQLAAWERLETEHGEMERMAALQLGLDLCGHIITPPSMGVAP